MECNCLAYEICKETKLIEKYTLVFMSDQNWEMSNTLITNIAVLRTCHRKVVEYYTNAS
jgi:hypothetical protein